MLKRKKARQAIASNNGLRLSTTKQKLNQTVSSMGTVFFMPLIQLFVLNSFHKEYQCPLFNVPTVSLAMSDRPIQATPTLTISNSYNAVFPPHRWRDVWYAGRTKVRLFTALRCSRRGRDRWRPSRR